MHSIYARLTALEQAKGADVPVFRVALEDGAVLRLNIVSLACSLMVGGYQEELGGPIRPMREYHLLHGNTRPFKKIRELSGGCW